MSYMNDLAVLQENVSAFQDELDKYIDGDASKAAPAARLRKQSLALSKQFKEFRAASVEQHRK